MCSSDLVFAFKAMVNAKTAKEIGIQIPDSVKSKAEIIQ